MKINIEDLKKVLNVHISFTKQSVTFRPNIHIEIITIKETLFQVCLCNGPS